MGACRVGYAYRKGDQKFGQYRETFLRGLKDRGELATLYQQFMTAEHDAGPHGHGPRPRPPPPCRKTAPPLATTLPHFAM